MAHIIADRVRDTTTSTGTGALTLSGVASTGFQTFAAAVGVGNTVYYCVEHQTTAEWEVGFGTLTAATTLARTRVLASSNGGAAVSFTAGNKTVFGDLPASYFRQTLGRTNMIVNPHGSIQQESSAPITATAFFADQWAGTITGASLAASIGVFAGGTVSLFDPSYMYCRTTTAKGALATTDLVRIFQRLEGVNTRRLMYGGSAARGSWLRFRASCSGAAGTASVSIQNADSTRSFVQSFAVTNTPADYAVFVPPDTTGTWPTGAVLSAVVSFCFAAGSSFQTSTLGAWQAGNFLAANTQTNFIDTVNRELQVTDVQWSTSEVLLPFEPIDYAQELARCQRYFYSSFAGSTLANQANSAQWVGTTAAVIVGSTCFPETMRAAPLVIPYSPVSGVANTVRWNGANIAVNSIDLIGPDRFAQMTTAGGGLAGAGAYFHFTANARM